MNKAICVVPVSPMRAQPMHSSEQVSQLVFGDVCTVLESQGDFIKVQSMPDEYEGWCQKVQLEMIAEEDAYFPNILIDNWSTAIHCNNAMMHIPIGSNIGFLKNGEAHINGIHFSTKEQGLAIPLNADKQILTEVALAYLNTPYQWGGKTVFGVDCSGFTQMVYRFGGISLLRDASQQATQGEVVDFLQEVVFGDLAFFDNEEGRITHVGIMLNSNSIIHASGKVRVDIIDQAGIINRDTGHRSHQLRIVKRVMRVRLEVGC